MRSRIISFTSLIALAAIGCGTAPVKPSPVAASQAPGPVRERFQFVVMADRTGGHREGIFERAVGKVNLLSPEFVMSVGDLIEGNSDNPGVVNREWDEVEAILAGLKAPFHFVAGNHDFSNQVMAEIWRKRHGPDFNSFLYEGALFVILNSEDDKEVNFSDAQLAWLKGELDANRGARWTFLFLHKPLWAHNGGKEWERVAALLKGRKVTVFAGHVHDYASYQRGGNNYYVLATTGGIGPRRGITYGEFDAVALVTMTNNGPVVANILVDGVLEPDIVNERMAGLREPLERAVPVQATNNTGQEIRSGSQFRLKCSNSADIPLSVSLAPRAPSQFTVNPASVRSSIPAGGSREFRFALTPGDAGRSQLVSLDRAIPVDWKLAYEAGGGRKMEDTGSTTVHFEALHQVLRAPLAPGRAPVIDGRLDEWSNLPESCMESAQPQILPDLWKGPNDCSYRFGLAGDGHNMYVAIDVQDDQIESAAGWNPWDQDGLLVVLDARPEGERSVKQKDDRVMSFFLSPGDSPEKTNFYDSASYPKGILAACVKKKKGGYAAEILVPMQILRDKLGWSRTGPGEPGGKSGSAGKPGAGEAGNLVGTIRMNICVYDFDTETIRAGMEGYGTYMWWRPDWESTHNWPGSGLFGTPIEQVF